MANKIVSQMQIQKEELEALKKAYEDKKQEYANTKRAYTRLVNQTEDMKKELEGLYESLDKGPYKKTERFDSSIYDRIAELEEAIRVNDEKLGREKITYTETTTTTTRTVTVESGEDKTLQDDKVKDEADLVNSLSDFGKQQLQAQLAYLHELEYDLKDIHDNKENMDEKDSKKFAYIYNILNQARKNARQDLIDTFPGIEGILGGKDGYVPATKVSEELGLEEIVIKDLDDENKEAFQRAMSVSLMTAADDWKKYWEDREKTEFEKLGEEYQDATRETITKIQGLVKGQTKVEFQKLGLDPALYLEDEEEIKKSQITLTKEDKEQARVAENAVNAVLENIKEGASYEEVRDEFVKQVDLEKDTILDGTFDKIQDVKERLDIVLEGSGEKTTLKNIRQQFKQKRAERQLAHELGIKRKDLSLYQKAVDDAYDRFNGQGDYTKADRRTVDYDALVLLNDVLGIDDSEIERLEQLEDLSNKSHKLITYEKCVDEMTTEKHIETSKEILKDLNVCTVKPKNNDYEWSITDTLTFEVHDLLQETYDEFEDKEKELAGKADALTRKYDTIDKNINETTSELIDFFTRRNELEEVQEDEEEQEDETSEAAEAEDDENLEQ